MSKNIDYRSADWLYHWYWNGEKSSRQIGKICGVSQTTILKWMKKFNLVRRKAKFLGGENNPSWKGGLKGYWGKKARRVWVEFWGIDISKGHDIHHIDKNIRNNKISNLRMLTHGHHTRIHNLENNSKKKNEPKI